MAGWDTVAMVHENDGTYSSFFAFLQFGTSCLKVALILMSCTTWFNN